jgi:acyl-[acyl-carrier-protein] desaturase
MATPWQADPPAVAAGLYRLYRDFFTRAEIKRRWSLQEDIPWDQCNRSLDPAVADVVESFCAVELFLPDYLGKIFPAIRNIRGWVWFAANWGYEESKHSLALADWLLRSGHRTDEQMADLVGMVSQHEWDLPVDSPVGMRIYSMVQERATALHYRNLRRRAQERGGDPALERLLMLVAVDEQAHYDFFLKCVLLSLEHDREGTLEQLRRVMNRFAMPAIDGLADSRQRKARVKELGIFDQDVYYREVYLPILEALAVQRSEMRNRLPGRKATVGGNAL